MFSNLNLTEKGMILVMVPVLFELLFVTVLATSLYNAAESLEEHRRSCNRVERLAGLLAETVKIGLTIADPQTRVDRSLVNDLESMSTRLAAERQQIQENKEIDEHVEAVQKMFERAAGKARQLLGKTSSEGKALLREFKQADGSMFLFTGRAFHNQLNLQTRMQAEEMRNVQQIRAHLLVIMSTGVLLSCLLSISIALMFGLDIVQRVRSIAKKTNLIAIGKDLPAPPPGRDEIATFDRILYESANRLRELRAKESIVLKNTIEVVCSLDKNLRFINVGAASQLAWGYSFEDLLGKSLLTLLRRDTVNSTRENFEEIEANEEAEIENILRRRNGTLIECLWKVHRSQTDQKYYCVVHDVSATRTLERLKKRFLAMASHDLRSPIAAMKISLENLNSSLKEPVPEQVGDNLQIAAANIDKLAAQIDTLLEIEKITSGKYKLNKEYISLAETIHEAKQHLSKQQRNRIIGPSGDAAINADPVQLRRAISGLIDAALTSAALNVSIERRQGKAVTRICQSRSDAEPISSPGKNSIPDGSTLLGPAIARAIVEAHGGQFGIELEAGKRRTYWFSLDELTDGEDA